MPSLRDRVFVRRLRPPSDSSGIDDKGDDLVAVYAPFCVLQRDASQEPWGVSANSGPASPVKDVIRPA